MAEVSKGHVHYWLPIEDVEWRCNCGELKPHTMSPQDIIAEAYKAGYIANGIGDWVPQKGLYEPSRQ